MDQRLLLREEQRKIGLCVLASTEYLYRLIQRIPSPLSIDLEKLPGRVTGHSLQRVDHHQPQSGARAGTALIQRHLDLPAVDQGVEVDGTRTTWTRPWLKAPRVAQIPYTRTPTLPRTSSRRIQCHHLQCLSSILPTLRLGYAATASPPRPQLEMPSGTKVTCILQCAADLRLGLLLPVCLRLLE